MLLDGKIAIVTGGGGGLGSAIALKLASMGAVIVVSDIDEAQARRVANAVQAEGGRAIAVRANVTSASEVDALTEAACSAFGTVDILVNNAGFARLCPSVLQISEEEWDQTLTVNLKSVFLCTKRVLKVFLPKSAGQIINIASLAGRSTSTIGSADYTTSKAGVIGFTRHVAREVASHGVRVNAVCPGPIDTQMVRGPLNDAEVGDVAARIPMQRLGRPADVANAVGFLASDDAGYITGACLDVNGGLLMI
jgi:NAD(P)-dependent dehydrogenase (short-subunit alcohol dehydrogenase family)